MLLGMTNDRAQWGPRLYAYLEAFWTAAGQTRAAWTVKHGLQDATVSRWEHGVPPRIEGMLAAAEAAGVRVLDVLMVVGIVDAKDVEREPARAPKVISLEDAVLMDPELTDGGRKVVLAALEAARGLPGPGRKVRVSTK